MVEEGKVTIFMTSGPDTPQRCATPFYMANVAVAMDNEAEMVFQIDGTLLMKKGLAENLEAKEDGKKSSTSYERQRKRALRCGSVQLHYSFTI